MVYDSKPYFLGDNMNKKGFTLIELLAVILIIGVISLIAIPSVSKLIEESKRKAAKQNANTYVKEVEKNIVVKEIETGKPTEDGKYSVEDINDMGMDIKGKVPDYGYVDIKKNKVENYNLIYDEYNVKEKDGEVTVEVLDDINNPAKVDDVYFLDLKIIGMYDLGDLDHNTGQLIENGRRIITKKYYEIRNEEYDVLISEDYKITIYEFDSNKVYLGYKEFTSDSKYTPSENVKYFKVVLSAVPKDIEKTLSSGQWGRILGTSSFKARISVGDIDGLKDKNELVTVKALKKVSAATIRNDIFNNNDEVSNDVWNALVYNKVFSPNINTNKKTYYISEDGDDKNSGLSMAYPKRTLDSVAGEANVNILLKCGDTIYSSKSFTVSNGVTISSYGEGNRPVLSFYRNLNKKFTKVADADNIYVTDLTDLSIYNGNHDKSDVNIGQLVINGVVNFKRVVFESSSNYSNNMLTKRNDEKSWSVDFKNGKLYIYTSEDPNTFDIKYAPPITGLYAKKANNITIKGIEIRGAGLHAINFANTTNVNINSNSFNYIGGSILTSAGIRYGNAVQIWDSAENVQVHHNVANWIFDTCYTNQGSSSDMMLKNVNFHDNIGMHSQWGLETWGDGGKGFTDINYGYNLLYQMGDITNPNTKMQVSSSGHLYGEVDNDNYITYRNGYSYHQAAGLAFWCPSESYMPSINNNIFWGTNRFHVIGTWYNDTIDINTLNNNLFYEEYYLSYNTTPALYKFKTSSNKYFTTYTKITTSPNTESNHKRGSNYDNSSELITLNNLIKHIINE